MVSNHFQNAYVHTKEQTESPEHGNYVGEAREKAQDSAKALGNAAIRAVGRAGKEAVQKIRAGSFLHVEPENGCEHRRGRFGGAENRWGKRHVFRHRAGKRCRCCKGRSSEDESAAGSTTRTGCF
jgi:hypothetical protein